MVGQTTSGSTGATGGTAINLQSIYPLRQQIQTLVNNELRVICRSLYLPVSGTKAVLQNRIFTFMEQAISRGDVVAIEVLRYKTFNHGRTPPDSYLQPYIAAQAQARIPPMGPNAGQMGPSRQTRFPHQPVQQVEIRPESILPASGSSVVVMPLHVASNLREGAVSFAENPFYQLRTTLSPGISLRNVSGPQEKRMMKITIEVRLDSADILSIRSGSRVMLCCTRDPTATTPKSLLGFPTNCAVKVDGVDVKLDLRGLRSKAESVMPADLTDNIDVSVGNKFSVEVAYSPSNSSKFYLRLFLGARHGPDALARKLLDRPAISKEAVVAEIQSKNDDPDITATHVNMSLRDPLTLTRMTIPCRGRRCVHFQCFDGETFLSLQEQGPTWSCPICSTAVRYEDLTVDNYMMDILKSTVPTCESVTVEPDGSWHVPKIGAVSLVDSDDESDEDRKDIIVNIEQENRTGQTAQKRTRDVIDLTLSDDDDMPMATRRRLSAEPAVISSSTSTSSALAAEATAAAAGVASLDLDQTVPSSSESEFGSSSRSSRSGLRSESRSSSTRTNPLPPVSSLGTGGSEGVTGDDLPPSRIQAMLGQLANMIRGGGQSPADQSHPFLPDLGIVHSHSSIADVGQPRPSSGPTPSHVLPLQSSQPGSNQVSGPMSIPTSNPFRDPTQAYRFGQVSSAPSRINPGSTPTYPSQEADRRRDVWDPPAVLFTG